MKGEMIGRLAAFSILVLGCTACDEDEPKKLDRKEVEAPEVAEQEPEPTLSPPILTIGESGPTVRGMTVILTQQNGNADSQGRAKLHQYLSEEKQFLKDQTLKIAVDRHAQPQWVAIFLSELAAYAPKKITIATDTRSDFPKELPFVPQELLDSLDPCTLIGTITEDRGTAIWRVSGGAARKRGRGMGGPDLSMTADTILSMKKGCDSDVFFSTAVSGVEWGLVYDLAASAIALEGAGLERASVPKEPATAGHALE